MYNNIMLRRYGWIENVVGGSRSFSRSGGTVVEALWVCGAAVAKKRDRRLARFSFSWSAEAGSCLVLREVQSIRLLRRGLSLVAVVFVSEYLYREYIILDYAAQPKRIWIISPPPLEEYYIRCPLK